MAQRLWKRVWQLLVKKRAYCKPSAFTPKHLPKRKRGKDCDHEKPYGDAHGNFICNSQNLRTIQMPSTGEEIKIVICSHNVTFSAMTRNNNTLYNNMDKSSF